MKKSFLYILLVLIAFTSFGQEEGKMKNEAEDHIAPDHIFHFDPLSVLFGTFKIGYEQKIRQGKNSILIKPHLRYMDMFGTSWKGGGGEVQFRILLNPLNPKEKEEDDGLLDWESFDGYFAPYARYKYQEISNGFNDSKNVYNVYEGGVTFGFKTPFAKYFLLDLYFGGGVRFSDNNNSNIIFFDPGYSGVFPRLGFTLGVPL